MDCKKKTIKTALSAARLFIIEFHIWSSHSIASRYTVDEELYTYCTIQMQNHKISTSTADINHIYCVVWKSWPTSWLKWQHFPTCLRVQLPLSLILQIKLFVFLAEHGMVVCNEILEFLHQHMDGWPVMMSHRQYITTSLHQHDQLKGNIDCAIINWWSQNVESLVESSSPRVIISLILMS